MIRFLSFNEAKQTSIIDYLAKLGFEPAKIRGIDHWYYSPFREERTPSFKVNTSRNIWFDHGSGEGGTILDLGSKLNHCTLSEFVEKLSFGEYHTVPLHRLPTSSHKPENKLEILSVKTISNSDLISYLNSRGIDVIIANQHCKEIEFAIGQKQYNAIGFPNQAGAFELRNRWFKGSSSPKEISVVKASADNCKIAVLEGFMDFLSVLKLHDDKVAPLIANSSFLILNSIRLLNRALPMLTKHDEINLFLDNDLAAKEAKVQLTEKGISFYDASKLYGEHKDVNDYLIWKLKDQQGQALPRTRSKGLRP